MSILQYCRKRGGKAKRWERVRKKSGKEKGNEGQEREEKGEKREETGRKGREKNGVKGIGTEKDGNGVEGRKEKRKTKKGRDGQERKEILL